MPSGPNGVGRQSGALFRQAFHLIVHSIFALYFDTVKVQRSHLKRYLSAGILIRKGNQFKRRLNLDSAVKLETDMHALSNCGIWAQP